MPTNLDLFEAKQAVAEANAAPPGLRYTRNIITPDEEAALAAEIARLELRPFEFHGYLGLRRVHSFGYRYDYTRGKVEDAEGIPDLLLPLRHRVADFAGRSPDDFRQALVTEYAPGAPIGWHKDRPVYGVVAGVSLISPCTLRLRCRRADGRWDRASIDLEPRSAYLLSGESRWQWEHSIRPMQMLRYSLTFRTLVEDVDRNSWKTIRR